MKKLFLTAILLLSLQAIFACDICGCSSGSYFIGPMPLFHKHFFGIRYSFRSFNSRLATDATQFSKDFYQTAELWGGINIGKRWQLMAFVPYNMNKQHSDDGTKNSHGFGDITLLANYKLFDKKMVSNGGKKISQQCWVGGGVKLPTGKFAANPDDIIADANNQPGTGTVDFLVNASYSLQVNKWGINSNVHYKMNNAADKFQFGNRFSAASFLYRSYKASRFNLSPNAGVLYENLQANKLDKSTIAETGGYVVLAAAGLETGYKRMIVGFNAQLPLSQQLSNGQTNTKIRGMFHVTYSF